MAVILDEQYAALEDQAYGLVYDQAGAPVQTVVFDEAYSYLQDQAGNLIYDQYGASASDLPQVNPGPGWLAQFKHRQPRPSPPPPGYIIPSSGGLAMTPMAIAASGIDIPVGGSLAAAGMGFNSRAQVGNPAQDIPAIRPGGAWFDQFKPGMRKPRPTLPALVYNAASGGLAMAPLAFAAESGNYGGLGIAPMAISAGATTGVTGPVSLNMAAMAMSGTLAVPFIAASSPAITPFAMHGTVTVNPGSTGGLAMAPLGIHTPLQLFSPPISFEPGPTWASRFKKQTYRRALKIPAARKFIGARGSLAMSGWGYSNGVVAEYEPFPQFPLPLKYEILINGTWLDISQYVYQRDNQVITRGLPDETQEATPGQMTLTLNNRDGRFSPNNTAGAYYPYLTRNTQLRCSVVNVTTTEVIP